MLFNDWYDRLFSFDTSMPSSVFIFGPRGTGKTEWLKNKLGDSLYFDLLSSDVFHEFLAQPSLLESRIPAGYSGWIVIDEVQRAPELLNEVHRLISNHGYRFVLTGSSARALRRRGVNLLAGRAFTYAMHPLTAIELREKFDVDRALKVGLLPAAYHGSDPNAYLKSYIQTYLKEEVQQESLTRNVPLFSRFLQSASFSQGETLNYAAIARDLGINRQTVVNFFDVVEDLLIARRLPTFNRRAKRLMVKQSKFYYFDVGVYQHLRPKGPLDSAAEIAGPALETLVLQQLLALNDYRRWGYDFYYWRTHQQQEVDFVLYGERGLHAIEVKRSARLSVKDFRGIKTFAQDYPEARCWLLYGGDRRYHEAGIEVLPVREAIPLLDKVLAGDVDQDPNSDFKNWD